VHDNLLSKGINERGGKNPRSKINFFSLFLEMAQESGKRSAGAADESFRGNALDPPTHTCYTKTVGKNDIRHLIACTFIAMDLLHLKVVERQY
jgi:hypothetical protein